MEFKVGTNESTLMNGKWQTKIIKAVKISKLAPIQPSIFLRQVLEDQYKQREAEVSDALIQLFQAILM